MKKIILLISFLSICYANNLIAEDFDSEWPVDTVATMKLDEASFLNTGLHNIAVQLMKNYGQYEKPVEPIAVTTFVDLNYLYRTSPFGRFVSEQLMGELQRAGFNLMEIRKGNTIMTREHYGEYILSRDINELRKDININLVLVGTYVVKDKYVFVNARIVDSANVVHSSAMHIIRRDTLVDELLRPSVAPPVETGQKIAIKGFGDKDMGMGSSKSMKEEVITDTSKKSSSKDRKKALENNIK
jgi:TolB-like protein